MEWIGVSNQRDDQFELAARLVNYKNVARYRFRGKFLFEGIPLTGARVLDVGCGPGAWAIWAALEGASKVVGIEPEAAGSSGHPLDRFRRNIETLGLQERVEAQGCTLQELPVSNEPFDVVIVYNAVNHLDENAVVTLHSDRNSFERYVTLLKKLRLHMSPNGWTIVADCGRDNLWPRFGLPSPFMRSIEWQKHQNPETWINVFAQAGFRIFDLRWSPLQPFPKLTGNRFVEYLTCSHFVLRFRVNDEL
jgi:cyclopropane fatty-acyl-phospholipid synthase-like methyltransferase